MGKIEKVNRTGGTDALHSIADVVDNLVDAVNELQKWVHTHEASGKLVPAPEPRKEQIEICASCYQQGWNEARKKDELAERLEKETDMTPAEDIWKVASKTARKWAVEQVNSCMRNQTIQSEWIMKSEILERLKDSK